MLTQYSKYTAMNKRDITLTQSLLRKSGLSWSDTIRLVIELTEQLPLQGQRRREQITAWREAIRLGAAAWKHAQETETVGKTISSSIRSRSHLRETTKADLNYLSRRFLRSNPDWEHKPLRAITTKECRLALERAFRTPSQFKKGRAFLHSVFSFGEKQEWCGRNPVTLIGIPMIHEKEIRPLTPEEIRRLLHTATRPKHRDCAPALGLMLWAGIRPHEVRRLKREDIDLQHNVILLRPRHTKTGGARHVSIRPTLRQWLSSYPPAPILCPSNWPSKWKRLRMEAGFPHWTRDVLRHTFASYHFQCHGDLAALQKEMGHHSPELLLTRYLNVNGLEKEECKRLFVQDEARKAS